MDMTMTAVLEMNTVFTQKGRWGNFTIEMVKPKSAPPGAEFLVAQVRHRGITLWEFRRYRERYPGVAKLRMIGGEPVIVLATRDAVHHVVPVRDLPSVLFTDTYEIVGGRDLKLIMDLKEESARILKTRPLWTIHEERLQAALEADQLLQQRHAESEAQRQAVREKHARRAETRAKLLKRPQLIVHLQSGGRMRGIPVVGDEWMRLPDKTSCVSVRSYSDKSGEYGEPIEWFMARKTCGGRVSREKVAMVSRIVPRKHPARGPLPLRPAMALG